MSVKPLVPVKEGDALFLIHPLQYEAKVDQLEAQILLSSVNCERTRELMKRGVGRQLDVHIHRAEVVSAKTQ